MGRTGTGIEIFQETGIGIGIDISVERNWGTDIIPPGHNPPSECCKVDRIPPYPYIVFDFYLISIFYWGNIIEMITLQIWSLQMTRCYVNSFGAYSFEPYIQITV